MIQLAQRRVEWMKGKLGNVTWDASLCWNKHAAVITHSHFSRNTCQINVAWGELAWRNMRLSHLMSGPIFLTCRGFTVPLGSSRVCQIAGQKLNQLMNKHTNKNQWPLQPLVFILSLVCVRSCCDVSDGLRTENRRRSHGLTIVPTLYVAAGPIVWW